MVLLWRILLHATQSFFKLNINDTTIISSLPVLSSLPCSSDQGSGPGTMRHVRDGFEPIHPCSLSGEG